MWYSSKVCSDFQVLQYLSRVFTQFSFSTICRLIAGQIHHWPGISFKGNGHASLIGYMSMDGHASLDCNV